jgi:acetyltransferase
MKVTRLVKTGKFSARALFTPASVAVIGAASGDGARVAANVLSGSFAGPVYLVDPAGGKRAGTPFLPTIESLPEAPELAIVATPPEQVAGDLMALGKRGTHAAIVTAPVAPDLAQMARQTGVRLLGPGSFGIAIPQLGLNASVSHINPLPGRLALVSQSASLCRAVLDWAEPNGVGFSHIVGIGGNADIGFGLVLDWLSRDTGTGAILLDIRRLKDRRAFISAARAASRLRPVVAIRPGVRMLDPSGRAAAVFQAALHRAGVFCVSTLEDLLAAAETLTRARPLRNEALTIVSNAISAGRLAADAALAAGINLADLPPEMGEVLRATLGSEFVSGMIYTGHESPLRLAETAAILSSSKPVGGILAVLSPTGEADDAGVAALREAARTVKQPMLTCIMGETTGALHRRTFAEAGLPVFATPEAAVRGFQYLVQDRRARAAAQELPSSRVLTVLPDESAVESVIQAVRQANRTGLTQDEALRVLAAYDLAVAPSAAARTAEEAAEAAQRIGFPVVVKKRRSSRPDDHRYADISLDLLNPDAVRAAATLLLASGAPEGLIIQGQIARTREIAIRAKDDPMLGPAISVGQAGFADTRPDDLAYDLPPLNLPLAGALVTRSRALRPLPGLLDRPDRGAGAAADALVRVSQLLVDRPEIAELEIDPAFVGADRLIVAGAWIRLHSPEARSVLAIPPYPSELTEQFVIRGEHFFIRPIRPEDAEAHQALIARIPPDDLRYRFFSAVRELSPEQIARLTQIDYDREMAFVAVRESTGETVGVSRLVREGDGTRAEFAVVVEPSVKGYGLASHLMERLIEWGRAQKLDKIVGQVLTDNRVMLGFVRRLGFELHPIQDEPDVVEAVLAL